MLTTYPMNNADYGAEDAELFHCTRTSGIFEGDDFGCSVTGADNYVTVAAGIAWIRNAKFKGKVVALREPMALDMGVANDTYPRIDAVVIRFDANAGTELIVKHGTAVTNPSPPEVVRTEAIYELHLYHVRREAGAASIPVGALTDVRMDSKYCGKMRDDVTSATEGGEVLLKSGGAMTGAITTKGIILTKGVDYGPDLPANPEEGRLFFEVV